MGKHSKANKREKLGKGKVTPVQIAFIVGRYLEDNHYMNALSAFKSEAADLFSKTKGKEPPKGLLGLSDILDEYISLKEQKLMVDQEKRRFETALSGFQDVMRAYYSVGSVPLLSSTPPLPPYTVAASTGPFYTPPSNHPCNASPPGQIINASPMLNLEQRSLLQSNAAENRSISTHVPKSSSANKRKAAKPFQKFPSAPKKSCVQSLKDSFNEQGNTLPSEKAFPQNGQNTQDATEKPLAAQSILRGDLKVTSPVQGSAVATSSLFNPPSEPEVSSGSPKTPGQSFCTQANKFSSLNNSPVHTNAVASQGVSSSNCSVISTKTIIVSPLKDKGYFAVERSYHVTSTPLHLNSTEGSRREHIRGRLDFDDSNMPASSEKPVDTDSSTSSTDGETQEFDFDLPDLDMLDRDFSFSQLLVDFDIDCEEIPCKPTTTPDLLPGPVHNMVSGCMEINQTSVAPFQSSVMALSPEDSNMQASDSVTALTSVTKCIIVSPAKTRRNSTISPVVSPRKHSSPTADC